MLPQADQKQSKNPVVSKIHILCMLEVLTFGKPSGPCLSEVETGQRPTQWIEKKGLDSVFKRSDSTYRETDSNYKESNSAFKGSDSTYKGSDSTYKRSDFATKQFFYASQQPDLTSGGPNFVNKQLVTTNKRSGFTDKRPGFADKHSDFTERQSGFAHKQTGFAGRRKPTFEKRPLGSYFARYPSLLGFLEKYLATRKTRNVIVTLETPDKERSQQENEAMAKREKDEKELDEVIKFRVASKISGTGISYKCRLYPNACNKIYSYHL